MPPACNEPGESDHETCMAWPARGAGEGRLAAVAVLGKARKEKMGKRKGDERKKAMSACPKG